MKFCIKRTLPLNADKSGERNPIWLIAAIILCWASTLNLLTEKIEPIKTYLPYKKSGSLLINPYIRKNKLHLSKKIKISLREFYYLNAINVIEELKKGDTIWYVTVESTGVVDLLFKKSPKVVAFGNRSTTYLSTEDYNKTVPVRKRTAKKMILITILIPFLFLIIRYGFIDKKKREFGLHFYRYDQT